MIPTSGNDRKAQKKSPFPAGNRWKTEAVLRAGRSRNYLGDFRRFPPERTGICPEDNSNFPA